MSFPFLFIERLQHLLDEARLRQCSGKFNTIIDDGFRHSLNTITLREVHELGGFYYVGGNMLVFDG
jgi:hypothetical protein